MKKWVILIVLLSMVLPFPAVWAQAPSGQEYVVKAGDVLHKVAEEYLGDPKAYQEIVDATNLKAAEDLTYAPIANPDAIEVGQKLWIPTKPEPTAEPTVAPTAAPTPQPKPVATVAKTDVIYYVPEVPASTQEGSCWTSSFSTPAGWRCMVGNSIYDPCLIATDGKTVVCGIDTPGETEFALRLTEPLPEADAPAGTGEEVPYKIELADGTICGFMTGATVGYDDKRMNYGCDDEVRSGIFGELQQGTVWMAERTVGEMTDDGFKPTQTQMIPLSKVWFMGPKPALVPAAGPTAAPTQTPTTEPEEAPTGAPAPAPTQTPTVAPTKVPARVTKTDVVHFVPDVPKTTQEGSCWTSSFSTPAGYRCTVDSTIYDPCLVATDGKTVVCGLASPDEQAFALELTEDLPDLDAPAGAEEMPFRLDLANGAMCNFATGTLIPVGNNVVQYYCSDTYGILDNIQKGTVWKANEVLTGDMDANGKVELKDSRTIDVAKAWYGPEMKD